MRDGTRDDPNSWAEDESRIFAEYGRAMIPGREEIERVILDLIPASRDEPFLATDIGTGTGWLSGAVLREFPRSRLIALDGSERMIEEASRTLHSFAKRYELRRFRLEEKDWIEELPPARVFLSSLVLHHLDGEGKRKLFARILEKLEPGGALLFADLMEPLTGCSRRHFASAWSEEVRRRSVELHGDGRASEFFEREEWNIYDHPDPMDKPSTLPEQLHWLREAGFEGVDAFWARAGHAVLGGYRP